MATVHVCFSVSLDILPIPWLELAWKNVIWLKDTSVSLQQDVVCLIVTLHLLIIPLEDVLRNVLGLLSIIMEIQSTIDVC